MTKQSKKTLKGILCGIVSFLLLGGIIVGSIALAQNVDFRVKTPEEKLEQTEDEAAGGDIIVSDVGEKNSALKMSISRITAPIAGTSTPVGGSHMTYKLTAELTPAGTSDKLDLALSGTDASKITLNHEDGAFEATLTVTQAFSNTVTLTGTIRNRNITDSINLDYLAKPQSFNGNSGYALKSFSETFNATMKDGDYAVGSVKPSKISGALTLTLDDKVYNALKTKWTDLQKTITIDANYDLLSSKACKVDIEQFISKSLNQSELSDFKYDFYWAAETDPALFILEFNGNYFARVNGAEINCGQFNNSQELEISVDELQTPANDLDLGGNILFW